MSEHTTDHFNPMISVQEFSDDGKLQIIHGYSGNGFRVAGQKLHGSQFLWPRLTQSWQATIPEDITAAGLLALLETQPVELVILGLGKQAKSPLFELAREMKKHGVRIEVMSTAAACRTWNVLLTEGRMAAAGLLAVD